MNIEQKIREQIEKNRDLKLEIGYINNHLSILEGLLRNERDDVQKQVNEAYQRGYDKGYADKTNNDEVGKELAKDIYQRGLEDGRNETWEAARKVAFNADNGGLSIEDLEKAFDCLVPQQVFKKYTAQQTIDKLKAYEEKRSDKIKRGDIVNVKGCCKDNLLGVVTKVWEDNCYIMWGDGSGGAWSKDSVVKTGKHIDIEKTLGELRYDS